MPTPVDLTDKPLELSPEFVYQVGPGSAEVYVAELQGSQDKTNEKKLKDGDVIDSHVAVTAFAFGDAVLWQYSQDEEAPSTEDEKPKPKAKAKAKTKAKSSSSSKTRSKSTAKSSSKK